MFLEVLPHVGIVQFEARGGEAASLVDVRRGPPQRSGAFDRSFVHEVGDLGEEAARPCDADRERLGVHLVAPLDAPAPTARVAHRDARLRAAGLLLDELVRGDGTATGAARAGGKIERGDLSGIAPQRMSGRRQPRRPRASQAPRAPRAPNAVDDVDGDRESGGCDQRPDEGGPGRHGSNPPVRQKYFLSPMVSFRPSGFSGPKFSTLEMKW